MEDWYKNCFAYENNAISVERERCIALTELLCKTKGKCPFFKTKEQHIKDKLKYSKVTMEEV